MNSTFPRLLGTISFAAFIFLMQAMPTHVQAQGAGGLPSNARFQGLSLGGWGAEYYRSLLGTPANALPLPCGFGYRGRALLLATSGGEPLDLECTVAPGTPIAFPINAIAGLCTGDPADCGTIEVLRADLAAYVDQIDPASDLRVEINGVALSSLGRFRAKGDFTGVLAGGSVVGNEVDEPLVIAAQDGYWMVLPPLPAGHHTLNIYGRHQPSGFEAITNVRLTVGH